ncbi:MAG: polyphosphate polymerase domain-containing protein [Anaerolineales bacterium]
MKVDSSNINGYRYERKFVVSELSQYEIESLLMLHPAMFFEIYHSRFVNNLYFDSPDRKHYLENIDGLADRVKVRIRWYGDLFGYIEEPTLELKLKYGLVGRKEVYPLSPLSIDGCLENDTFLEVFAESNVPDEIKFNLTSLELSLLNRYRRKYFKSVDGSFRITIDTGMECYLVQGHSNTFLHKSVDAVNTVVELKYAPENDSRVDQITKHFPFRMTKSSKYVNGVERLSLW